MTIGLRRRSAHGGYESDASTFTFDDPIACFYWAGGDLPIIGELPCQWIDAGEGTIDVDFPPNAWNGLEPGLYQAVVRLGTDPAVDLAYFEIELRAGPARGVARPGYISAGDLEEEYPGLEKQLGNVDVDQSGFANLRADARNWLDLLILSHYRPTAFVGPYQFEIPWLPAQPETNEWLADLLADGCLLQWTPNGRRLRKAQVYYVLGKVFRRAACTRPAQAGDLLDLADHYERKANDTLCTSVAEIDSDGDEIANFTISLRTTVTRRR